MTEFIESPRFPDTISFGSAGGPSYNVAKVNLKSGKVVRREIWSMPLYKYSVVEGIKKESDIEELLAFFHVCGGSGKGFRFKDFLDYKSCALADTPAHTDQIIGTGDTILTTFQFIKKYTIGSYSRTRIIKKPVNGTVLIGLDGILSSSGFTIDYTNGTVIFDSPVAQDVVISWGGEFDTPCMFASDEISNSYDDYENLNTTVELIEDRL